MADKQPALNILLIGSGVIGSVYAGQLALVGHNVSVLAHGGREADIATRGIDLKDVQTGSAVTADVQLAKASNDKNYDLVLVAVQAGQLSSTFPSLKKLFGRPEILFIGNNPDGHKSLPTDLPATIMLGFPGVSGQIKDGLVEYIKVDQQPTALEKSDSKISQIVADSLQKRGFKVQNIADMDGWLAHHTVFIACISMAILQSNSSAKSLANDKVKVKLMCRAIEEGFSLLKSNGVGGAPKNLSFLHSRWLRPIAINYWTKLMKSPKGDLYFASHVRNAPGEVRQLANWVMTIPSASDCDSLARLLGGSSLASLWRA